MSSVLERLENEYKNIGIQILGKQEAFKLGTSPKVAEKMFNIIGRRIGKPIVMSQYPTEFSNKFGKFLGFYGTIGTTALVRINFLQGKSESVHGLDYFTKNPRVPDFSIHLMGSNIVQVIDQIADALTNQFGDRHYNEEVLTEGEVFRLYEASHADLMIAWFNNEAVQAISTGRSTGESEFRSFSTYCDQQGKKPPKHLGAFLYIFKQEAKKRGLRVNIPSIEVTRGIVETPIITDNTTTEAIEELQSNIHLLKFRVLEYYVQQIAQGSQHFVGCYIYGDGGIGKSYLAKKYLEPLPNCEYMTGKLKDFFALAKLLYVNRKDKIIVLDDVMTAENMKNTTVENILKAALDPEPPRRVRVRDRHDESSKAFYEKGTLYLDLSEQDYKEYQNMFKSKLEEDNEVIDMTVPLSDGESETNFTFNSKLLFLTNYSKVPQALEDRCWTIEMIFNNQQIMDIIETNIAKIAPNNIPEASELFQQMSDSHNELDMRAVATFMRTKDLQGLIKRKFSGRIFNRLLALYSATKHTPMWEKFLLMELKA